jgi:hypothetical protein
MEGWEELQSRSSLRAMLLGMRKQFLDLEGPREEEISFLDGEQFRRWKPRALSQPQEAGHMIGERLLKTGDG